MTDPASLVASPVPALAVPSSDEKEHAVATTGGRSGHSLDLESISHSFGSVKVVDDVSLPIEAGELVALLGPSGCGKTTLLRIIGGFVAQSAGRVRVDGRPIDDLPANRRDIGIVFQNYALFPHMTVTENVAYGLRARGARRALIRERVDRMLAVVQLEALRERMPRQLSGGQQQRVALARALAVEPRILLLDEPFGALDKNLRLDMQIEVKRLQRRFGITAILVTHDQEEAMTMADRIAVMSRGRVEQFASPVDTYTNYQTVSTLKARGVDIEFVKPDTGPITFYTTIHVVKNAANKDNAYKYIDAILSTEVQAALQKPPYSLLSVNKNVPLQPDMPVDLVKSHEELAKFVHHDWRKINPNRAAWIERFNREVRQ